MDDDRCISIAIDYDTMLGLMTGRIRIVDADLPADVKVAQVHHDWRRRQAFGLILHSASFEPVPVGEMYPQRDAMLRFEVVRSE